MNQNCPYCQSPDRYDLEPAEELETVTTTYARAEGDIAAKATHRKVRVMGHRSRHPIAAQPHFHVACQKPN